VSEAVISDCAEDGHCVPSLWSAAANPAVPVLPRPTSLLLTAHLGVKVVALIAYEVLGTAGTRSAHSITTPSTTRLRQHKLHRNRRLAGVKSCSMLLVLPLQTTMTQHHHDRRQTPKRRADCVVDPLARPAAEGVLSGEGWVSSIIARKEYT